MNPPALARLARGRYTVQHIASEWLCGKVSVKYHTRADFRSTHAALLGELLTQSVAALMHQGLVDLEEVAQNGLRVRASAGAHSFRREKW